MANLNNPAAAAQNWSQRTQASAKKWLDGVNATQVNPMDAAAQAADTWFQGVSDAHQNNRFASSLQGRPIGDWKGPCQSKGQANYQTGAAAGAQKYQAFAQDFFPFLQQQVTAVKAMDGSTKAARKARMNEMFDRVSAYTYRR